MIEDEMKKYCDDTVQEEYKSSPTAFLGGIRYVAIITLISIIIYLLSLANDLQWLQFEPALHLIILIIAVVLLGFSALYLIGEVMRYHLIFDFLFPKKISKNIIGTINPAGEVKHTVIFSGHHDSAYEFNLFYYLKTIGAVLLFVGLIGIVIIFVIVFIKLIFFFLPINLAPFFIIFGIVFLVFIPLLFLYMFFHTYNPVPGAFDNLSAVSIVLGLGKYLSENKKNGEIILKNTRVHLISFAGEEAGLRGAKAYVKKHYDELKRNNTVLINMDGIGMKDEIILINTEVLCGAKHDSEILASLFKIAEKLDIKANYGVLPFGATDAAVFSRKKLPAVCIQAWEQKASLPSFYHTRSDTPDVVEKEALGQVCNICLEYLKELNTSK